jgi:mono/diheme cytochrome c family protein
MSTRSVAVAVAAAVLAGCAAAQGAKGPGSDQSTTRTQGAAPVRSAAMQGPDLGRLAAPEEVAAWDISIAPDGSGLPPGSGTPAAGAIVYAQQCQACHGDKGGGQPNDRLVGGHGTLAGPSPVRTIGSYWPYATTVFDYVRRAMPYPNPRTLSDADVYAVTAYLLHLNGIIAATDAMNAVTLPAVTMPNRGNFTLVYPPAPR